MSTKRTFAEKNVAYYVEHFKGPQPGRRRLIHGLRLGTDFLVLTDYSHRIGKKRIPYLVVKLVTFSVFVSERVCIRATAEYFRGDQIELAVDAFLKRKKSETPFLPSGLGMSREQFLAEINPS